MKPERRTRNENAPGVNGVRCARVVILAAACGRSLTASRA